MNPSHTSSQRRRSLVSLGGTVLAVIVLNGLIAVFGLHYANEQHLRSLDRVDGLIGTLDTARAAEVHFKKQVQEWKNTLLRGDSPEDFAKYTAAFDREQAAVRLQLESLAAQQDRVDPQRVAALLAEHSTLAERYAGALAGYAPGSMASARATDAAVRGIDRPLTRELDALVGEVKQQVDAMRADLRAADAARYDTVRTLVLAATGVGAVLIVLMLLLSLRQRSAP